MHCETANRSNVSDNVIVDCQISVNVMKSNYLRFSVTDIGDNRDHRRSSNQLKIVSLPTVVIHRFRLFARGTTTRWKSWHKTPKRVSIISLRKNSNGKSAKGTSTQYFLKHGFTLRFATFVNTCHYPYDVWLYGLEWITHIRAENAIFELHWSWLS